VRASAFRRCLNKIIHFNPGQHETVTRAESNRVTTVKHRDILFISRATDHINAKTNKHVNACVSFRLLRLCRKLSRVCIVPQSKGKWFGKPVRICHALFAFSIIVQFLSRCPSEPRTVRLSLRHDARYKGREGFRRPRRGPSGGGAGREGGGGGRSKEPRLCLAVPAPLFRSKRLSSGAGRKGAAMTPRRAFLLQGQSLR